jgi:hypothetical protein
MANTEEARQLLGNDLKNNYWFSIGKGGRSSSKPSTAPGPGQYNTDYVRKVKLALVGTI